MRSTQPLTRRRVEARSRPSLGAIEAAFGNELSNEAAQGAINAARRRALRRSTAGSMTETTALLFAGELFVALGVERRWEPAGILALVASLQGTVGQDADVLIHELLRAALHAPELMELSPTVALEVQLATLVALSAAREASVWAPDLHGRLKPLAQVGATAASRRAAVAARAAVSGDAADGRRASLSAVPVSRWLSPWGALVGRFEGCDEATRTLEEAADAMRPIVERASLLERSSAREHSLVRAGERRLGRLAYDLHDGALQHVAALRSDLSLLARQLGAASFQPEDAPLRSRGDDLQSRAAELDRVLRELAHSLEPVSLTRRPLEEVIAAEIGAFRERTDIEVDVTVHGETGEMTPSQKIALIRVLQEALTNIREHAAANDVTIAVTATRGSIELEIRDDGRGFDVAPALQAAARRGRLGLVGSSERVRLLGGTFNVRSCVGGPTIVAVSLPRWQPPEAEHGDGSPLYAVAD